MDCLKGRRKRNSKAGRSTVKPGKRSWITKVYAKS